MKIRLLCAFLALSLASCSSNDDTSGADVPDTGERKLYRITQTDFNADGSVKLTTKTDFDDNDRALFSLEYDGMGELSAKREFSYTEANQLASVVYYAKSTGWENPDYSHVYTYDDTGRVIKINETYINNTTAERQYQYNPNNTITLNNTSSSGATAVITYHVNNSGQIFKRTGDLPSDTEEISYSGENILTYTKGGLASGFVFDNEHTPKGQHHNVVVNQHNGHMVNTLLLGGLTSIGLGKTRYAIKRNDSNGDTYDYVYQFDKDGYPLKVRYFKNQNSIPLSIREIAYK